METSLYKTLGVAKDATEADLRSAYRKLARTYHPDVNPGDKHAEERFKEVASAYEVLSDADKRKSYDEFGVDSLRGGFDPEQARAYSQWQDRRERSGRPFRNEYVDLEDLFGGAYDGQAYASAPARGADILAVAELELAQVVHGTEVSIQLPGGSTPTRIRIPAGAETGSKIRLRGRGGQGRGKGPAGDLVIETRVKPHPLVRRKGLDLSLRVPITLAEAYNGGSIEVPTFSGIVKVTIPPGSQNRTKLRLRNKGISGKNAQGDFFCELDVRLPDIQDTSLAQALGEVDALYTKPVRQELVL